MTEHAISLEASLASRILPLAGIVILLVIACIVRPAIQYRRHGTLGINIFNTRHLARNLRDALLILMFFGLIAQGIVAARRIEPLSQLLLWPGPLRDALEIVGMVLIPLGLVVFALAELQMGASWRIGIDDGARPGLVTHGLYSYCRNPIYFGLLAVLAGYAALLPTRLSAILLIATYIGLRVQTSAEEDYLQRTYGKAFRDYAARVGRFVPGLGLREADPARDEASAASGEAARRKS